LINVKQEIEKLLKKYPDPRNPAEIVDFNRKLFAKSFMPVHGVVVDNKDPECLGRLRVSYDMIAPGSVSPWLQTLNLWSGNDKGMWVLPDIGTQVVIAFLNENFSNAIVLGCIYDLKHRPPEFSTEKGAESYLWQTKNHRIEIIDEKGKEGINIETAKGKVRCVISKDKGIEIANELGDIKIKCRKLSIETGKNIELNTQKKVSITCDGSTTIKSKNGTKFTSDKEVKIKGDNIKLSGTKGVATEGKQIAVQGDKVMGFDTHIMVIPAGPSTATVPLPHPFIGKINDKVSDNVKIKDKGVATKGSKAKHDDSMHMQLPGTIKFQNNPKKEGEVTGGTGSKVKVNGKEVAVIGSQVTTCNDVGMQNNSTIIAVGTSIPMPTIINPLNTEEYKKEQKEQEKKEPKFTNVRWAKTSVEEGEEIELTASVQDIADTNMITLQIFPEGKGPENGIAVAKFPLTIKDGSVSAKWLYNSNKTEMPPKENPKFSFSAHSAWCNFEKSSNTLEVKLIRPEITKVERQDKDGKVTSKGLVGQPLKLYAETKDVEGGVTFHIYDEHKREVYSVGAEIKGDKAEAEWTYRWDGIKLDHKPKFTIEVTGDRCKKVESGVVEIGAKLSIKMIDQLYSPLEDIVVSITTNKDNYDLKTNVDGLIEKEDIIPNKYNLEIKLTEKQKQYFIQEENGFRYQLNIEKENSFMLKRNLGVVS